MAELPDSYCLPDEVIQAGIIRFSRTCNYVMIQLNINPHQLSFMKQIKMSLASSLLCGLLIKTVSDKKS